MDWAGIGRICAVCSARCTKPAWQAARRPGVASYATKRPSATLSYVIPGADGVTKLPDPDLEEKGHPDDGKVMKFVIGLGEVHRGSQVA